MWIERNRERQSLRTDILRHLLVIAIVAVAATNAIAPTRALATRRAPSAPQLLTEDEVNASLRQRLERMRLREATDAQRRIDAQRRRVRGPDTLPVRPTLPRNPDVVVPPITQP